MSHFFFPEAFPVCPGAQDLLLSPSNPPKSPWPHSQDESDRQSWDGPQRNVLHVRACARARGLLHFPTHLPARGSPKAPPRYTQKEGRNPAFPPGGGLMGLTSPASDIALLRGPPQGGGAAGGSLLQKPSYWAPHPPAGKKEIQTPTQPVLHL